VRDQCIKYASYSWGRPLDAGEGFDRPAASLIGAADIPSHVMKTSSQIETKHS
jgi:hypothetical protein